MRSDIIFYIRKGFHLNLSCMFNWYILFFDWMD